MPYLVNFLNHYKTYQRLKFKRTKTNTTTDTTTTYHPTIEEGRENSANTASAEHSDNTVPSYFFWPLYLKWFFHILVESNIALFPLESIVGHIFGAGSANDGDGSKENDWNEYDYGEDYKYTPEEWNEWLRNDNLPPRWALVVFSFD